MSAAVADHYSLTRLRSGALAFVAGRGASAVLGVLALVLCARILDVRDYGAYVTALAGIEIVIALTTFGLDWAAVVLLPEYRVNARAAELRRVIVILAALRLATLLCAAAVMLLALGPLLEFAGLSAHPAAMKLFVAMLVAEGSARFVRDIMLASLFRQFEVQASQLLRTALFCALLFAIAAGGSGSALARVAAAEMAASTAALVLAVVFLVLYLRGETAERAADWTARPLREVVALAWHNYVSLIVSTLYSTQTLLFAANRLLGLEAAAVFGFARNLAEQIRRYLPAELMLVVVRPMVIARYARERDFGRLNARIWLLFKLGLFTLAPLVVFVAAFGAPALETITAGKYGAAAPALLALLLLLVPLSHRRMLELATNTIGLPAIWSRAAIVGLCTLPVAWLAVEAGLGVFGLIAAVAVGELAANAYVLLSLKRLGLVYRLSIGDVARIGASAALAAAVLTPFAGLVTSWPALAAAAVLSVLVFLALAFVLKPFATLERSQVNQLLGAPVFVW